MIHWQNILDNKKSFSKDLIDFSIKHHSLNNLRKRFNKNSPQLKLVYKLERIGVDKTRPMARKAIQRFKGSH